MTRAQLTFAVKQAAQRCIDEENRKWGRQLATLLEGVSLELRAAHGRYKKPSPRDTEPPIIRAARLIGNYPKISDDEVTKRTKVRGAPLQQVRSGVDSRRGMDTFVDFKFGGKTYRVSISKRRGVSTRSGVTTIGGYSPEDDAGSDTFD